MSDSSDKSLGPPVVTPKAKAVLLSLINKFDKDPYAIKTADELTDYIFHGLENKGFDIVRVYDDAEHNREEDRLEHLNLECAAAMKRVCGCLEKVVKAAEDLRRFTR